MGDKADVLFMSAIGAGTDSGWAFGLREKDGNHGWFPTEFWSPYPPLSAEAGLAAASLRSAMQGKIASDLKSAIDVANGFGEHELICSLLMEAEAEYERLMQRARYERAGRMCRRHQ